SRLTALGITCDDCPLSQRFAGPPPRRSALLATTIRLVDTLRRGPTPPSLMKILITGGAGVLGSRLIAALLAGKEGLPVTRSVAADMSFFRNADPRLDCRTGTITDADFVTAIVE